MVGMEMGDKNICNGKIETDLLDLSIHNLSAFYPVHPGVDDEVPSFSLNNIGVHGPQGIPGEGELYPEYSGKYLICHRGPIVIMDISFLNILPVPLFIGRG
jgi:hypothetical protein